MNTRSRIAVTGAFGYSGRYIAQRCLARGWPVVTLTNSPQRRSEQSGAVMAHPFHFEDPEALVRSLAGVNTLVNTYWVRFNHRDFNHEQAVHNTLTLFAAARCAGIERVVHVSITNPSESSPLPYFRGKARLERALRESGMAYSILRPAVLFGGADILINNIAWALRRFPFFAVFGRGDYRLQPVHVEDFADLAVAQIGRGDNAVIEAIGPETFTYRDLVAQLGRIIGCSRPVVSVPPWLGHRFGRLVGWWQRDEFITREEIAGLMADLLYVNAPAAGTTRLTDWARAQADQLGQHYASELARRRDRTMRY